MLKKACLLLLILCLSLPVPALAAKQLLLVTLDSPPMEFVGPDGRPLGFNVEIVREALRRLGYDTKIQFVPWQRALVMVELGLADGIIDAGYTKERARFLYYPDEHIYMERLYAFQRKGRGITLDAELKKARDYSLGIGRGFFFGGWIDEKIKTGAFKEVVESVGVDHNLIKLYNGRVDLTIGTQDTINYIARRLGQDDMIEVVREADTNEPLELGTSKTYVAFSRVTMPPDIAEDLGDVLRKMKSEGLIRMYQEMYH